MGAELEESDNDNRLLSQASLDQIFPSIKVPRYARCREQSGIVHLGPGAFHRAHQAAYIDEVLAQGNDGWGICGVSLRSPSVRDTLTRQDCLYTLAILDQETSYRVVGSVFDVLEARTQTDEVLRRLADDQTRIVSMTITEKGYCLTADGNLDIDHPDIKHDLADPRRPRSAIGYLVEGMRQRYAKGVAPFTPLSCDNLADNGTRLSKAVTQFASEIDPKLSAWIETNVSFPNSMVDSITPATDDSLRGRVEKEIGVTDLWPIQRESFTQWVVEDQFVNGRPPLENVGVTMAHDVEPFENAKLRLLNGAHSTLAYVGLLRGHSTVREAMGDSTIREFVKTMMSGEIKSSLTEVPFDVDNYISEILCRFENPEIDHFLSQIAWDGSQKLPFRIMGTVQDNVRFQRPTKDLAVAVAAWMHFIRRRTRENIDIVDPLKSKLNSIARNCDGRSTNDIDLFAQLSETFSEELLTSGPFRVALSKAYSTLEDDSLESLLRG